MKKIMFFTLMLLATFTIQAQQTILTSGGDASGPGGSMSYSVGQTMYTTITSVNNDYLAQGVQQAFEIFKQDTLDNEEFTNIELSINAYPNPTVATLFLYIKDPYDHKFKYQLFDINGRLIKYSRVKNKKTTISMDRLDMAMYTLVVITNNKIVRKFKIIKK